MSTFDLNMAKIHNKLQDKRLLNKYIKIGKTTYSHQDIVYLSSSVFTGKVYYVLKEDISKGLLDNVSYYFSDVEYDEVVNSYKGEIKDISQVSAEHIQSVIASLLQANIKTDVLSDFADGYASKKNKFKIMVDTVKEYDKEDVFDLGDDIKNQIMSQAIDEIQGLYPDFDIATLIVSGQANSDIVSLVKSTYHFKCSFIASVANELNKKHLCQTKAF